MGLLNFSLRKSPLFVSAPNQMTLLLKAMCLANIAKFFLLPIVIWKTQQSDFVVQLNFMLVIGYFICGLIHVHSGKTNNLEEIYWQNHRISFQNRKFICILFPISVISGWTRIPSGFSVISSLAIKSIMFNIIVRYLERNFFLF